MTKEFVFCHTCGMGPRENHWLHFPYTQDCKECEERLKRQMEAREAEFRDGRTEESKRT